MTWEALSILNKIKLGFTFYKKPDREKLKLKGRQTKLSRTCKL